MILYVTRVRDIRPGVLDDGSSCLELDIHNVFNFDQDSLTDDDRQLLRNAADRLDDPEA